MLSTVESVFTLALGPSNNLAAWVGSSVNTRSEVRLIMPLALALSPSAFATELINILRYTPLYLLGPLLNQNVPQATSDMNIKSVCTNPILTCPAMGVLKCTASPDNRTHSLGSCPLPETNWSNLVLSCALAMSLESTTRSRSPDVGVFPVEPSHLDGYPVAGSGGPVRSSPVTCSNQATVAGTLS